MKPINKWIVALTLMTATFVTTAEDASIMCLAKNIYYEAQGESMIGKLAVAKVTLNRVASPHFANNVCDVVYQKHQFSWTKKPTKIVDKAAWQLSLDIATKAIQTGHVDIKLSALYFHNVSIAPNWRKQRIAKIGNHYFYK